MARRFGVFDARQFVNLDSDPGRSTHGTGLLEDLLTEFHFVAASDKAAALAAIFTAVALRLTLRHALRCLMSAPVFASGKPISCRTNWCFCRAGRPQGELSNNPGGSHQGDSILAADLSGGHRI